MSHAQLTLKTGQAKLWILLVGVSQYHDRRFPVLQYSTIDAQRLADTFTDVTQEFPQTSIRVHHDSAIAPTLGEVRSSLQTIVEQAKPEDTVIFYFCGHGALDSRLQQVVFCLADTQKDVMLQTGLSAIGLLGLLGNCAAKQQIFWIDVAHANGMTPQTDTPEILDNPTAPLIAMFRQQAAQNSGFQALLSCGATGGRDQQSWKFPELGHGIFSHFLIEGLRGAAANPQGIVTASVLGNYVHDRTVQYIDRTNQQLEWLHRDTENRSSKAIAQTPMRIGQAQSVLGIKPKDPLEYLFPEIRAPKIDPPLDRSVSLRKPKLIVPPPIEKPSSIDPVVPPIQKIVPEAIEPAIESPVSIESPIPLVQEPVHKVAESDSEQSAIPLIQASDEEIVESDSEQSTTELIASPVQEDVPKFVEPTVSPIQESIAPVQDPIVESIQSKDSISIEQFTPERITPIVQEVFTDSIELPSQENELNAIESSKSVSESVSLPVEEPSRIVQPVPIPPARRKRNETKRQVKRFRRATERQLKQAATAIAKTQQAISNFAIAQQAQSKQRATQFQATLTTKLNALNQSVHRAANSGQTLYRQRTTEVNHRATDAVQQIDRSTRNLTQSANTLWNTATERTQKPETRQLVATGLKIFSVAAVGVAGIGLYLSRTDKIHAVQKLSSAASTQLEANQTTEALSTALKAGRQLQQVDLPWNFVPESLRISTIATLQQAIAVSEDPATPVGISLSNASLSPDQKTFAVSTRDNTIQLWQRNGDKFQQKIAELKGHKAAVTQLVFSPDGKRLASGSADTTIKLWNVEKRILIQTLSAHTQAITALNFRSDGEVLASGSADQTIKLWGVAQGRILDTFKGHNATANVIRFSPDGRILAAGTLTNSIYLWYPDSQNPILLGSHERTPEKTQGINDLAFSPDGKSIASAGTDYTIKLWTVGDAKADRETVPTQTLTGHENAVTSLSFNADGKILASGGLDRTVRLWNMQNGTFLKTLLGSQDPIEHVAFSSDGKALLSVGNRYGLKIWDLNLDALMQTGCRLIGDRAQDQCS